MGDEEVGKGGGARGGGGVVNGRVEVRRVEGLGRGGGLKGWQNAVRRVGKEICAGALEDSSRREGGTGCGREGGERWCVDGPMGEERDCGRGDCRKDEVKKRA